MRIYCSGPITNMPNHNRAAFDAAGGALWTMFGTGVAGLIKTLQSKDDEMIDMTAGTCPFCGGRLCVDTQYPDRIYCDTCNYPEPDEEDEA